MNTIREIQNLNKRELEANVSIAGSWHRDFDDTAYIYIGGLPFDLSEGDIITIFSQYGEPTYVNLIRDKETGKSKGFAFLKYEDQRSTDLAVDNLGGASIMGRVLKVDHTRYKRKEGEEEEERERGMNGVGTVDADEDNEREAEESRPLLKEEVELMKLEREHDEDDPMKEYLLQEKREEITVALARLTSGERKREKRHKHHHRHEDKRRDRHTEEQDDQRHRHRHSHRRRSRDS
jgi:RNA-binding motif X-linked protein 2